MRKLTLLFAALTLSVGMWAQILNGVEYIDAKGVKQTANNVTVITRTTTTITLSAGWYIISDTGITGMLVCEGAVHLILADGAKLTATGSDKKPGIQVSGDGNSLTIYGQANQSGQLIANGGRSAAGIGGGDSGSGSNITINGGIVTANGKEEGAGIGGGQLGSGSNITINGGKVTANGGILAAGIGGGWCGSGSNITINGGTVIATGGDGGAGIGGGIQGSASNITINGGEVTANGGEFGGDGIGSGSEGSGSDIFVATNCIVKADGNNPPTTVIDNDGTDLASDLEGKRYVTIQLDLTPYKTAAIAEINAAVVGITDETILAVATKAKTDIGNATSVKEIDAIKTLALAKINAIKEINAATKDLTLFPAEASYIDFIKSSIQEGDDINLINGDKQLGLDYIALHDAKLAAVAAVKHDMGDYAESEAIYNFIGGPAIEGAVDADKITEAKIAAIAKLEEFSQVLGAANIAGYNKGIAEAAGEILGTMATPCEDCNAVEITDGETTITLYSPKQVKFIKTQAEEE